MLVPITSNAPETPFVTPDPACVPSPTLDPIARIPVTLPLVSPMHNASYKMESPCVDAYQDSNYCPFNAPVSILTSVVRPKPLVEQELSVKIPWAASFVSARQVPLETPLRLVSALLPKSADPILSANPAKLASRPKANVCAEEDTTVIPKLENVKTSTSVWPVPNQFADQTQSVKICRVAMSANVPLVTVAIPSADVKSATVATAAANHPTFKSTVSVNWPDAHPMQTASPTRPNV